MFNATEVTERSSFRGVYFTFWKDQISVALPLLSFREQPETGLGRPFSAPRKPL